MKAGSFEPTEGFSMDRILVIDDDDTILNVISKMLGHLGYAVEVACDGETGIELLKNRYHFKVVITDIRMPGKDGNQVAKYIRDADRIQHTPILAITGFPEDADDGLFDSVLTKPFKMKDLINFISTTC